MKAPHTLIVGGTRGIGREVVAHFVRQGHRVSVIARHLPARKAGPKDTARYSAVDITDEATLATSLRRIVNGLGKINYLIFFQRYRDPNDQWQGEIETSLTATKNVVELLQDQFAPRERAIVIVSSVNATLIGAYLPLGYHVVKASLCQMVRYWALTLGPLGIRVNSVSPGTVLKAESKKFFLENSSLRDLYQRITPLGRFGYASEVADVIAFLCSSSSSFVTGQDIVVDGGVSLQWQEALARELLTMPHAASTSKLKMKS